MRILNFRHSALYRLNMIRYTLPKLTRRAVLFGGPLVLSVACSGKSSAGPEPAPVMTEHDLETPWHQITQEEWRMRLSPLAYRVLREGATERPFTSPLNREKREGVYHCAGCDLPLFSSATKYDSGTGWPSFWQPLTGAVKTRPDYSLWMERTEHYCARCGGHQGHVFEDGPQPTGLRYCNNGVALSFKPVSTPV